MSADRETVAFYDREAAAYAGWSGHTDLPGYFHRFSARLSPGSRVLDLGCGGGWAARALRDLGHRVLALDASAGLLAGLEGEEGIDTLLADLADLPTAPPFDAIWASYSLQHLPRADLPAVLDRIGAALVPGGWLFIGIHEGGETLRDALGRLYCHYSEAALVRALAQRGLTVLALSRADDKGYDGRAIRCMNLDARKGAGR